MRNSLCSVAGEELSKLGKLHREDYNTVCRRSHCGAAEMNLTSNHEVVGSIPGLA